MKLFSLLVWQAQNKMSGFFLSFPPRIAVRGKLRRESRKAEKDWIPAFAGMTSLHTQKQTFCFALVIIGLIGFTLGCERNKEVQTEEASPVPLQQQAAGQAVPAPGEAASISVGNVVLTPRDASPVTFTVEVAKTPEEKSHGLMGRENLADKHGMWFVFDEEVQDPFWMKDTPLALDIIFIDRNNKIVDIIPNAVPNSTDILTPHQKYRYVLEVKAGTAANLKLNLGDKVEFRLGPP
ncbi:MAG: DUF192 domain-containing protein [Deltaproteobacteria bacterium]|nr:DUF192 domain-containing protein [Deltaproteobacteria bacterium]